MSTRQTLLVAMVSFCAFFVSAAGAQELNAPKAPFASAENKNAQPSEKPVALFDAKNLTFVFGSKKIIFGQDGTFTMMSDSRKIGSFFFCVGTDYNDYQTNQVKKITPEYPGGTLCVTGCGIDETAKTITIKGLIPFHKSDSAKRILYPWTETATLLPDGKVDVKIVIDAPEDTLKYGKGGIFFELSNTRDYTARDYSSAEFPTCPDESSMPWRFPVITVDTEMPGDSFAVEVLKNSILQPKTKKPSIYLTPTGQSWNFVVDPLNYTAAAPPTAGGVDFLKSDDLKLPTHGKNLLPNPYFAQGFQFVTIGGFRFTCEDEKKFVLNEGGAKFGKYSLPSGRYNSGSIPADPGEYVFSFHVKGKGRAASAAGSQEPWDALKTMNFNFDSPNEWKRLELPFTVAKQGLLYMGFSTEPDSGSTVSIDGIQLEKGVVATAFEAPAITARLITKPADGFLESGRPMKAELELSTLEKSVRGAALASVRNFYGETVLTHKFDFDLKDGEYPRVSIPIEGRLPDGIFVLDVSYAIADGQKLNEHFRFSIMPFLKNEHKTAKLFSLNYGGFWPTMRYISESYLARERAIGIGASGHVEAQTPEVLALYNKYGVIPFNSGVVDRMPSARMKECFPELDIPPGHVWFYVRDVEQAIWDTKFGVLPDYRLVGGWSPEYKEKFQKAVIGQLKKNPGKKLYGIGGEWPAEIKKDPNYPDLVQTYFETVKSVYPDAWVAEYGGANMDIREGIVETDEFLTRYKGHKPPDFLMAHPYLKDIQQLYPNFKAFLDVAKKHGMDNIKLAFPEGMHFYPHDIPEWNCDFMSAQSWALRSPLSYDLGWIERLSAAYYARCWLVYLTEFERVWCVTAAASATSNHIMDARLTPRAFQKIPNTLGILFGNPKKFFGDYSFAPETKCFVWEDELGRPLAAVWNEDKAVDRGTAESPYASMTYKGAEYIDLMGVKRAPVVDGEFPVSPFALFIRGKTGDAEAFIKAISTSVIKGANKLPFRISDELGSPDTLKLVLSNELARPIAGTLRMAGETYKIEIGKISSQTIAVKLPKPVSSTAVDEIRIPMVCEVDGQTFKSEFKTHAFAAKRFTGDWSAIPSITLKNLVTYKKSDEKRSDKGDFEAKFQIAWDDAKLYLRVLVIDDIFTPGNTPGNRYDYDVAQVYLDTRCSARKTGKTVYDDDDYDYSLMPTPDGKNCEVFRALSPFIQYTLGIAAPKDGVIATEIPSKFTRTADGYIYEAEFPAAYILPAQLKPNYNMGFGLYVADRDGGNEVKQGLSLATEPGKGCYNNPQLWPLMILTE